MFTRLNLRIQAVLLTAIFLYIALSSWVVYRTMESRGTESLQRMSVQFTSQQYQNAELFKRWLEETVQLVARREGIGEALQGEGGPSYDRSLQPLLDGLRASNIDLTSLVLYGHQGAVYSSGNIMSVSTLEQLGDVPEIGRFLQSGREGEWMVLDTSRLYYPYGGNRARKNLFHFTKVVDEAGTVLGVLQLEASLSKLAGFFRTEPDTIYGGNRSYIVSADGQWLEENGLEAQVPQRLSEIGKRMGERVEAEVDDGILLMYTLEHSQDRVAILISNERMKGEIGKLGVILIIVSLGMTLLFVWLVRRLSRSVTEPLGGLLGKMRETMKEPSS